MASFAHNAAVRRGTGESVLRGRSHCPVCKATLSASELVPIVSFLVQRGRCRHCKAALPLRYLVAEVVGFVVYALIAWRYGFSLETVELMAFAAILLYCSLVDLDSRIIPDTAILAAIAVRATYLVSVAFTDGAKAADLAISSLVGGLVLGGALLVVVLAADKVLGRESMGGGDLKLFFVAGLYFGWAQGLFLVIVACIFGIASALLFRFESAGENEGEPLRKRQIPFGPSIAAACVVVMIAGAQVVQWYGGLL